MWNKIKKCAGYAWASPITLLGLVYVGLFASLGWYKWVGIDGDALVWKTSMSDCPAYVQNFWLSWAGHAIGNVVVMNEKYVDNEKILKHEQKHVDQVMRLGIFQPLIYSLCYIGIKFGCLGSHPYFDNPFEIDARRAAGQIIDVVGTRRKILESKKP